MHAAESVFRKVFGILIFCLFSSTLLFSQKTLSCGALNAKASAALEKYALEEAGGLVRKALHVCVFEQKGAEKDCILAAGNAGEYYYYTGKIDSAAFWFDEGLSRLEKTDVKDVEIHAKILAGKGNVSLAQFALDSAEHYHLLALELARDTLKGSKLAYGEALNSLGAVYYYQSRFEKADSVCQLSLKTAQELGEKGEALRFNVLTALAAFYEEADDFQKAIPIYHELLQEAPNRSGYEQMEFWNNYHFLCSKMGRQEEALGALKKSLSLRGQILGKETYGYCIGLMNLAGFFERTNQAKQADSVYQILPGLTLKVIGEDHYLFGNVLMNYAVFAYKQDNYELADSLIRRALVIREKAEGKYSMGYSAALHNFAYLFKVKNDVFTSDSLYRESLYILDSIKGNESLTYGISLADLAWLYDMRGRFQEAFPYYEEVGRNLRKNLQRHFLLLSEKRQEEFYEQVRPYFMLLGSFCFKAKQELPQTAAIAFDNALILKHFRLENGKRLRRAMEKEKDSALTNKYHSWLDNRRILAQQISRAKNERSFDIDELIEDIEEQENELMINQPFRSVQQPVSWESVKESLDAEAAAVEFYHFRFKDTNITDSTIYCALLLLPGYKYPEMIYLFEEKQLDSIIPRGILDSEQYVDLLYRNPKLYQLIWKPLESRLDGVKRVYYSPSGLLHLISLPAVSQNVDELPLADKFDLHYMSSTRELVAEKEKLYSANIQYAVAYGGIRYETDSLKMAGSLAKPAVVPKPSLLDKIVFQPIAREKNTSTLRGEEQARRGNSNDRSEPRYLHGSLREMKNVEHLFKSHGIFTMTLSEYEATEESFKRLGRTFPSPDIIHVSTHGFFTSVPISEKQAGIPSSFDSSPLFRSKLLFAGCLDAWNNKPPLPGFEDGILHAGEVANLNLSNTKLAVLSACETGLGEIRGGEGVYGLQRAFKLAGTEYIIMSLWKIPDDVTVEFIDTFYRIWFSDEAPDVRDAFLEAQRKIKEKYHEPYYWAAFVLA